MPEEAEKPHPDYVKGFNEGYLIAQHLPELAAKLPTNLKGDRGQGFIHGRQQFLSEKEKDKLPFLKNDRLSSLNKQPAAPSKSKSKDGPEQ